MMHVSQAKHDKTTYETPTDSVVRGALNGNMQLGAYTVCATNKHGIGVSERLEVEYTAETANFSVCAWTTGGTDERLDAFNELVSSVDRDACCSVCEGF